MPPRVSHLVVSLALGGLERLVVDWANVRNQQAPGSTRIVCLDTPGELAAQVDGGAVDCVNACRARRPMDWAAGLRLRRLLLRSGAEVVHSHNVAAWQYAAVACIGTGIRHIHTEHGTNVHYQGIVNRVRLAVIRRLTDQIVAVSESAAEELVIKNRIPRKDIVVIVNGVAGGEESGVRSQESEVTNVPEIIWTSSQVDRDLRARSDAARRSASTSGCLDYYENVRERMGIPQEAFVIGSVGRLAQVKGYDRLIAAFAEFSRSQTTDSTEEKKFEQKPAKTAKKEGILPQRRRRVEREKENVLRSFQMVSTPFEKIAKHLSGGRGDEAATPGRECGSDSPPRRVAGISDSVLRILNTRNIVFSSLSQSSSTSEVNSSPLRTSRASVQISSTAWYEYFLLFVGDGPERGALEQQARDLGVSDRVIFAGYQPDPMPYLAAMNLFVLPSRSEGLSVALLEAMAAGVPVAVTDVGANREVVEDGKCGVILPDDERKWPDMIAAIMNNPETIADNIQVARQRVRTCYSLKITLDGYDRLYRGEEGLQLICTDLH